MILLFFTYVLALSSKQLVSSVFGAPLNNSGDTFDVLKYVDPLIGTLNGGNVFPGATIPYGMAKPGADTDSPSNQGGFVADGSKVTGFSNLHDSGTGGQPSLGNFALFPYATCPEDEINQCVFPKRSRKITYVPESLMATPGYFKIKLQSSVTVDMTATAHTSLFRFRFPHTTDFTKTDNPLILMDLTDLANTRQDNGTISVDSNTGRMTGGARFLPSFGQGSYKAYFCADFVGGQIRDTGIFVNSKASSTVQNLTISRSINGYPLPGGAFIRFKPNPIAPILVRVGLSFINEVQACQNAEREIADFDFDDVKRAAEMQWREKLGSIRIDDSGTNLSFTTIFYSGINRTMINPQDYTNENPLWTSSEPYFDSFYCLWDSFRSQIPFLTIIDPRSVARMIRSLIDTYVHEGWLPDCRMSFCKGYTQGGSNADMVLGDAYVKGLTEGIDWKLGYEAMVKDAEVEPFDWCCNGRGGLDSWKELGYIPVQDFDYKGFGTMTRSISRTLEYSANDFVISQVAKGLGKTVDEQKYIARSSNWKNLFNKELPSYLKTKNTNFIGFFQPKHLNKTWGYQDPLSCSQLDKTPNAQYSLTNNAGETFESSIWEYGFYVPHDQGGLMAAYDGQVNFLKRLTFLHDSNIGSIGNEPSFLTIFQYHYAGRPGLSTKRVHYYVGANSSFTAARDGIPGNDDSGVMGSFVAFCMMGVFPNPGQDVYLITTPLFRKVSVTSPLTGQTATIEVENFDEEFKSIYIQNATLDGVVYRKNWLTHDFFLDGGTLVLNVGREESLWGTRIEDLPPSLSEYPPFNSSNLFGLISMPSKTEREDNGTFHRPTQVTKPKSFDDGGLLGQSVQWLPGHGSI